MTIPEPGSSEPQVDDGGHGATEATESSSARVGRFSPIAAGVVFGALLLIVLGAAALRSRDDGSGAPASSGSAAVPEPSAPKRSDTRDFAVTLTSGQQFRLSEYRGHTVVLEFLAPGCASCAAEVAVLGRVTEDFKDDGVVVLVLDIGGMPRDKIAGYYRGLGGGDALLYAADEKLQVARQYNVQFLGTTIVLGRDGSETYRDGAGTELEKLAAAIEAAR